MLETLKKKKLFKSSKDMVVPSSWLQSCLECLSQWSRKVLKFSHYSLCLKTLFPSAQAFSSYDCGSISIWYQLHMSFSFICKGPRFSYSFTWGHLPSFLSLGQLGEEHRRGRVQMNCLNDPSVKRALWNIQWDTLSESKTVICCSENFQSY